MIETLLELWLLSADLHFSIQVHPLFYDHVLIILNHWEIGMEMLLLSKKKWLWEHDKYTACQIQFETFVYFSTTYFIFTNRLLASRASSRVQLTVKLCPCWRPFFLAERARIFCGLCVTSVCPFAVAPISVHVKKLKTKQKSKYT